MTGARRNLLWPMIVMAVGSVWLLLTAGAFPEAVGDLLLRSWPVLVILFGLDVLIGQRRVAVAGRRVNLMIVVLGAVLVNLAGIMWLAYQQKADELRDDQRVPLADVLPEAVEEMSVSIDVKRTSVILLRAEGGRTVEAEFTGSNESEIDLRLVVDGSRATLTAAEDYPSRIPLLEDYGRGELVVYLPAGIDIDELAVAVEAGDVVLDVLDLAVQTLAVRANNGDLTVSLPRGDVLRGGRLHVENGGMELTVPQDIVLTLGLAPGSGRPSYEYDTILYDELVDGTLDPEPRDGFQVALDILVDGGAPVVVVDVP